MSLIWFIIRGSGIAAFVLFAASIMWGLMISTKTFGRAVKAKGLTGLHEALGLGAILAVIIHVVAVRMDDFIGFSWPDVLIPGVAEWEPIPTALGVVSLWVLVAVVGSFYAKGLLGPVMWKAIHRISLGAFVAAVLHAVFAGTDTQNPWMISLYVGSVVLVGLLTVVRILLSRESERPARARTPRPAAESAGDPESEKARL